MEASVREFKNHLSRYLRAVNRGQSVVVTSHKKVLAKLIPFTDHPTDLTSLFAGKSILWNGKKPKGGRLKPGITGKTLAERVLEDRR